MVPSSSDLGEGGRGYSYVKYFLRHGCPCHPTIQIGDGVVTPLVKNLLGVSHHGVARRTLGNIPRRRTKGTWEYPPLGSVMSAVGIEEIETYIFRRQNTVV